MVTLLLPHTVRCSLLKSFINFDTCRYQEQKHTLCMYKAYTCDITWASALQQNLEVYYLILKSFHSLHKSLTNLGCCLNEKPCLGYQGLIPQSNFKIIKHDFKHFFFKKRNQNFVH